jgi:hypothetical protein
MALYVAIFDKNNSDDTSQDRMGLEKLVKKRDKSNSNGRGRRGGSRRNSGRNPNQWKNILYN